MQLRIQSFCVAVKVTATRKPMFLISTRVMLNAKIVNILINNDKYQ